MKAQRHCNNCGELGHYWRQCPKRGETSSSHVTVQRLPAFVHIEVIPTTAPSLSAKVETVLTTCDTREWLLDSGASKHMTPSKHLMTDLKTHKGEVIIGDNFVIPIHSEGMLEIIKNGKGGYDSSQVFYVPNLGYHLMSVSELCKLGMRVVFDENTVSILEKFIGKGS